MKYRMYTKPDPRIATTEKRCNQLGISLEERKVDILVKSQQNYKSEWESADFKAVYEL